MKNVILFDLDGTLSDSSEGILNALTYALKKYGVTVPERKSLYKYIGPELVDIFRDDFGMSDSDARLTQSYYREYYSEKGKFENTLYNGIPELLSHLRSEGKILAVATGKPTHYSKEILEKFDILKYFEMISGYVDDVRCTKTEIIKYALQCLGADGGLMVGDRFYDIEGAKGAGIKSVGVLYGFGTREELKDADFIAEKIEDLYGIL